MAGEIQLGGVTLATELSGVVTLENANFSSSVAFPSGHVIKTTEYNVSRGTYTTGTFPFDDTPPQITEGVEIFSQSYTPSSAASNILIKVNNLFIIETSNVADAVVAAVFISGDSDAKLVLLGTYSGGTEHHANLSGEVLVPSWSGAKTISVRKGTSHQGVQYWLTSSYGSATTYYGLGSIPSATIVVQEIA